MNLFVILSQNDFCMAESLLEDESIIYKYKLHINYCPVCTQRHFNVHTMSSKRYGCCIDV